MKTLLILLGIIALSSFSYASSGCCNVSKKEAKLEVQKEIKESDVKYIDKEELQKLIKANDKLAIIDVLSPESYIKGHVKGAINIPLKQLDSKANIEMLKQYKTVVVYCANKRCKASTKAAMLLMKHGIKNVVDYEGGIADYKAAKLPMETGKQCKCGAAKESPVCCK